MASAKQIWLGVYIIPCGMVNAFIIDGGQDGLILIDTGLPEKEHFIYDGIRNIGRRPSEVTNIILTHAHVDHIGGLAELVRQTGAKTWMHELDAPIAETGGPFRYMKPSHFLSGLALKAMRLPDRVSPVKIDHLVKEGDVIPLAGGLEVIAMPGHSAGQIALLWKGHRVLFAGDACVHVFGMLNEPIGYENAADGQRSLQKLGTYAYDLACFGHGSPLRGHASEKIARRWPVTPREPYAGAEPHGHASH